MHDRLLVASTAHNAVCAVHVHDDFTKSIFHVTDMHSHMHQVRSPVYNLVSVQCQTSMCKHGALNPCISIASGMQDPTGEAASEAQKQLVLYELDLGLNHVIRKSSEPVDNGANLLIPVPGGEDGPGGVLVCAENYLIYMKDGMPETIQAVIPRRNTLRGDRGVLIVAWAKHQVKTMFFFLLQVRLHCITVHHCMPLCGTLSLHIINMFVGAGSLHPD